MCGETTKFLKIFIFIWKLLGAAPPPSCRRSPRGEQICLDLPLEVAVVPTHRKHSDQVSGPTHLLHIHAVWDPEVLLYDKYFVYLDCITNEY